MKVFGELQGARPVAACAFLLFLFLSGCAIKMQDGPSAGRAAAREVAQPAGTISMPSAEEQKNPYVKMLGYLRPRGLEELDKKSIARGKPPAAYRVLANPIPADSGSIARGSLVYARNCAFCHGSRTRGDGPVAQLFLPVPPDLTRAKPGNVPAQDPTALSDGDLFYYITMGPATMPSFGDRLSTRERFDVVNYIRSLQKAKK